MAHPRMYDDLNPAIRRLREICLALPQAFEKEAWGECTFRVTVFYTDTLEALVTFAEGAPIRIANPEALTHAKQQRS